MKKIEIYTDGSCYPNPGAGSNGFVILENQKLIHEEVEKDNLTTNNKMELKGMINALKWVKENKKDYEIVLHSDSEYGCKGITQWVHNWKKFGWTTKDFKTKVVKPVSNKELWVELDELTSTLKVKYVWVKGHDGNHWNEYVDRMISGKGYESLLGKKEKKPIKIDQSLIISYIALGISIISLLR